MNDLEAIEQRTQRIRHYLPTAGECEVIVDDLSALIAEVKRLNERIKEEKAAFADGLKRAREIVVDTETGDGESYAVQALDAEIVKLEEGV